MVRMVARCPRKDTVRRAEVCKAQPHDGTPVMQHKG